MTSIPVPEVDIDSLVPYRSPISDNWRWAGFEHRPDDVFVCTPPKCGTTWTQTIVTTLVFGGDPLPDSVAAVSPWLEMRAFPIDAILGTLGAQAHRRCIKSHTPADGIPWFDDCKYLVVGRDGRDAFMSFLNHLRSMRQDVLARQIESAIDEGIELADPPPIEDVHAFFAHWLEQGDLFRFIDTYWSRRHQDNLLFVHFNDLKADLAGQMRRIAAFLDLSVDQSRWDDVVAACTFESMKSRPDEIAPFDLVFEGGADSFLYKGTNGRWQGVLTDDELDAYTARAEELLEPDAAAWLRGEPVAGVSD